MTRCFCPSDFQLPDEDPLCVQVARDLLDVLARQCSKYFRGLRLQLAPHLAAVEFPRHRCE